ncbi:MAG: peptidoglycan editing factor PgeF, partial [Oscillospiraceae bacterium]|nr:peptidoglycan editing factor PgeF [Oscillospiraceae bacterium]
MAIVTRKAGALVYLADEQIPVPHAFTTRLGGVSEGIYESLNLGARLGDDPAAVAENYDRIAAVLGISEPAIVLSRQVHGDCVRTVRRGDTRDTEADGLVTDDLGTALAVFTADCIPILLWDAGTGAVGAVHAGWRGTVQDIVGKAVGKLLAFGADPRTIRAAIGPGIGSCCFETDTDVPQAVRAVLGDEAADCIQDKPSGKAMVNLKEVNRRLLIRAGVPPEQITVAAECTMCAPDLFWSHRKTE